MMNKKDSKKIKLTSYDIASIGLMVAVIEVCKMAFSFLPNIELTSFWLILFTLFFGWKIVLVVPVFILIEGAIYGFGLWWIMYLYAWPLLVLIVYLNKKKNSVWFWSILSGLYGLMFGALCSLPYIFMGYQKNGGFLAGIHTAFTWFVSGIPFDIVHGIGNFVIMLFLYHPMVRILNHIKHRNFM